MILLGDYVGYGADPEWAVQTVMDLCDHGALAGLGNHDQAIWTFSAAFRAWRR